MSERFSCDLFKPNSRYDLGDTLGISGHIAQEIIESKSKEIVQAPTVVAQIAEEKRQLEWSKKAQAGLAIAMIGSFGAGLTGTAAGAIFAQEMEDSLNNLRRLSALQRELPKI